MRCNAVRQGDEMNCHRCRTFWGINEDPIPCASEREVSLYVGNMWLERIRKQLDNRKSKLVNKAEPL